AIVPKRTEVSNLLVPVCLSASHIAFGSIRMEPVFMVLAQSAAVAACIAIDQNIAVQDVRMEAMKAILKANPKADFRKPDVLSMVSNTDDVEMEGAWKSVELKGYGPYHLENKSADGAGYMKFKLDKAALSGKYTAYYYYPRTLEGAETVQLTVFDGKEAKPITVNLKDVKIMGQTSSTWVEIGTFIFNFDAGAHVNVAADPTGKAVAANAILLVPRD